MGSIQPCCETPPSISNARFGHDTVFTWHITSSLELDYIYCGIWEGCHFVGVSVLSSVFLYVAICKL